VRPYLAVFRARFVALLQYRAAAAAGFSTQLFWGLIRMMIFTAFFTSSTKAQPMTLPEVVTYIWLGQALIMLMIWRVDPEIQAMMTSGNIAYELLKPVDLYSLWYAREVAARTAPTLLRSIPLTVLALAFLGMGPPASGAALLAFTASLLCAVLLSAAITTLSTVCLIWMINARGLISIMNACVWIFSGMILPLPLFPEWAKPVLEFLPFRGLADTPFRIYSGNIAAADGLPLIGHQVVWTIALVLLGKLLLARARSRLVVQGG
jgi:ABC-2 type transport system permease protein